MEIPEPWATALIEAGITDPRNASRPSWQELRRRTGIHPSTLTAMAYGMRATKQENIDKVAEAIRVPPQQVAEWVGRARTVREPYAPPAEANLLDRDERQAVDRIIALLAKTKMEGAGDVKKKSGVGGGSAEQVPPASTDADDGTNVLISEDADDLADSERSSAYPLPQATSGIGIHQRQGHHDPTDEA